MKKDNVNVSIQNAAFPIYH